ncbi:MAG: hypothetical protein Ct9H300mP8_06560 [Gammaproteobacteria bacterium]|nr:MAG: hypothetical protein Ct9H300mP8_06560 [Gammaproteobacteria bacterium]
MRARLLSTADDRSARELAEFRADRSQEQRQALQQAAKLDNIFANLGKGEKRILKLVLKTDVRGFPFEAKRNFLPRLAMRKCR